MTGNNSTAICSSCKFYLSSEFVLGQCRRYPKQEAVPPKHWCGEFVSIPEVIASIDWSKPVTLAPKRRKVKDAPESN
jgi:hypothetical protein